jgi:sugar phosphate isomerase/epimerase
MAKRWAISLIGDEVGGSLDDMIRFCGEHGLSRLELRTVGGRNLLGMTLDEVRPIARKVVDAGLGVPCFVSPILKWAMPGKTAAGGKVDFAFDPASCPAPDPMRHAFEIARLLGAPRMRIFSWLDFAGWSFDDLAEPYARLCALAEAYDVDLLVENEPVCTVRTLAELRAAMDRFPHPRLRPLIDICNAIAARETPSEDDVRAMASRATLVHLKDYALGRRKVAAMGEGDIDWGRWLGLLIAAMPGEVATLTLETHVPGDGWNATARSLAHVRTLLDRQRAD